MSSSTTIKLAISTCPNDTFAFHGLLEKKVDWRGVEFETQLLDIQQLNEGLFANQFDVAKASFHAAILLSSETVVLPSGSALGFGVGPLLLGANESQTPDISTLTLCPGEHTTATLLFKLFYGDSPIKQTLFSEIMPELIKKSADFGVCIHEGRFTWQQSRLFLVEDLGTRWEQETGSPLPLGGILASRSLPSETTAAVQAVIQDSINYGLQNRNETLLTMRKHAQEFDDQVLFEHVDLYVNDFTVDLGTTGREALKVLSQKAIERRIVPVDGTGLTVFES